MRCRLRRLFLGEVGACTLLQIQVGQLFPPDLSLLAAHQTRGQNAGEKPGEVLPKSPCGASLPCCAGPPSIAAPPADLLPTKKKPAHDCTRGGQTVMWVGRNPTDGTKDAGLCANLPARIRSRRGCVPFYNPVAAHSAVFHDQPSTGATPPARTMPTRETIAAHVVRANGSVAQIDRLRSDTLRK